MVDDDADQLEITQTYLEDADPSLIITGVTTPKETLELLDEQRFDCIVSDYMMPGMNGIELAGKIRKTSDIPFIIYTGQGSEEVAEAAFAAGIDDYMRKEQGPSYFKVLAKRIRSHVDHHQSRLRSQLYLERIEALHWHAIGLGQSQNEDEIFRRTIDAMEKTLGHDIADILMVEKGRLKQVAYNQLTPINVELPLDGKGVTVKAVREKHSVLVDNVDEYEDYFHLVDPLSGEPFPGYPPSQSELASPILLGEEAVGVLNAESTRRNAFTEEDVKLLETLAAHISTALGRLWNIERLEELVDERTREITYAERMTAAARVTAMVGHDLLGPLVTISNAAYLARQSPEKAERMLTMIENNASRSIAMIEELRERLREKPLLLGMTDLGALIRTATEEAMILDSVKVVLRLNDNLGSVMIDASQMRRVLDNLISNALDAMPGGGVLNVAAYRDGEAVRLEVSDTGVGISEEDMGSLFTPFHSGKSRGLGLGLAFCKQTVEAHGGVITVESEVSEGTLFAIRLPLI